MSRTLPQPEVDLFPQACDMKSLGRLIRDRRARSAVRIEHAAELLGVSKSLSRLENGQSVSLDKLFKVLDGLGLTVLLLDHEEAYFALRQNKKFRQLARAENSQIKKTEKKA